MMEALNITNWILPIIFILGGLLLGIFFEVIVLKTLKKVTVYTSWQLVDIVLTSLHRMPILWFTCAGIYGAILSISVRPQVHKFIQDVLVAVVILSITIFLSRIAVGLLSLLAKRTEGREAPPSSPVVQYSKYLASLSQRAESGLPATSLFVSVTLFANVVRLLIILIGVFIILQNLGISITPLVTALGIGGLAVALALQDTLSNLFAGFHIIASKQVRPGDYVKLDTGDEGYVTDVNWRNTVITPLPANNIIIIPNSKFASAIITNYNLPEKKIWVPVQVGVSYNSDLEKVEKVTLEVAKETVKEVAGGVLDFEPLIRYHTFGDSGILFTVRMLVNEFSSQFPVKHEFIKRLHRRYKEEGIEIPFPTRTVYLKEKKDTDPEAQSL
ncbi:MAG TPA: mechanosensitive ion channel family protein [Candidatus Limnocylindrales bacterium]|nr:mechanosensitive ion channel family protein [Candidatus Limnocylindrales bacterium]